MDHADRPNSDSRLDRRDLLKGAAAAGVAAAMQPFASELTGRAAGGRAKSSLIREENQKPGHDRLAAHLHAHRSGDEVPLPVDRGLRLARERPRRRDARLLRQHQSGRRRSPSTSTASATTAARAAGTCTSLGPFDGQAAARPARRRRSGCASASGSRARRSTIPDRLAQRRLPRQAVAAPKHRYQSYVIFIVRDDRPADFLFQCSDNTWQAYNRWPDNYSLYDNDRKDRMVLVSGVQVSFDRPYGKYCADLRQPAVARLGRVPALGVPARLLDGAARLRRDLLLQHRRPRRSATACCAAKAFLSVGHDEYWSLRAVRPRAWRRSTPA